MVERPDRSNSGAKRADAPKRKLVENRIEEINQQLQQLHLGDEVTISYYCFYGRQYRTITGTIVWIDLFWKELQIGETVTGFSEIDEIINSDKYKEPLVFMV